MTNTLMQKPAVGINWQLGLLIWLLSGVTVLCQIPITKQITIQPVQLRDNSGLNPANVDLVLLEAETDKIWAQAGIDVKFLPVVTYNSTTFSSVSSNPAAGNSVQALGQITGQPWSTTTVGANVVRVFFVKLIDNTTSVLGFSVQSGLSIGIGGAVIINQQTAIAIADNAFALNRRDVLAHELGHILGLDHGNLGAGGPLNLMTGGGTRTSPTTIDNIFPDGSDADQLTGSIGGTNWGDDINPGSGFQIDRARRMTVSVDLPGPQQFTYKYAQTITFATLSDRAYSATPFTLSATTSSGLAVTFSVVSGPATVNGNELTMTGGGLVTVRASQSGNAAYNAAPAVDQSFTVTGAGADFTTWQQANFTVGELADANVSGPNAIFGLDGYPNLVKYALGLDPKINSTSGLPVVSVPGTDWVYTYTRPSAVSDVTYTVEISTDLINWSTVGVTHELVSTDGSTETWRARYPLTSATNVFFRLKIVQ